LAMESPDPSTGVVVITVEITRTLYFCPPIPNYSAEKNG